MNGKFVVNRIKELLAKGFSEDQVFNQLQIDELTQTHKGVSSKN